MLTSTLPSLRARPFLRLTTRDKFLLANSVNVSISSSSSSEVRIVCARDFRVSVLPNPVQRLDVSWLFFPTFPVRPLQFCRAFPGMSAKNCRRRYRLCSKISCSRSLLSLKCSFSRPSGDRVDDARVAGLPEECSVSCRQLRSLGIVSCETDSRHFPGLSPFTVIRIISGFLVGVLTIVCGFSRGRFLLFTSLIASEQDEDIERKDSLLTTSFSGGFATIFVFFGSVLVICDDALFAGDFSCALDLLFVAVSCSGRCSDVFRNTSCSLSETALRDLSTGRFCLFVDELFTTVPNESILVCTSLVSFSLCFCKTFLTSTGEESSCDLLSLLQDCSCSFFVKRSFSLFGVERGSDFILSRDFCLILVAEIACLDGTFTAVSLSSFTEDSRIFFDAGDVEEQT
ncbi:hypothetical protein ALC53_11829 [Atta colombica]|uniref:Transmembrane protein n=1 Tax=Atta colombica TaxID=520822 RepID=A0A195B014_9HYME|nr:hypothetical protein ALC53_11829 [Atta colombica]